MADSVRRRAVVHGEVQGVFFRDSTKRIATERGVAGWVRNRPDGAVEAVVEGPLDGVDAVIEFMRDGPTRARVERVDVEQEPPEGLTGFEVR